MKKVIVISIALLIVLSVVLVYKFKASDDAGTSTDVELVNSFPAPTVEEYPQGTRGIELLPWGFDLVGSQTIPAPAFEVEDLEGNIVRLADYQGEILILKFWATWCSSCKEEIPSMEAMMEELQGHGISLLAVSTSQARETVRSFVEEQNVSLHVANDDDNQCSIDYGIRSFPTIYILDKDGNYLAKKTGKTDWDDDALMDALIALAN